MFDCNPKESSISPKQIEINTISVSYVGIAGNRIKSVHARALRETGRAEDVALLPNNSSTSEVAKGIVEGWNAYGNAKAVVMFLVYKFETNTFDQRALQFGINSINANIIVRRRTFDDVIRNGNLQNDGKLFM